MNARRLDAIAAILALSGLAVAAYLTWVGYAGLEPVCAGGGEGCQRVQGSPYSELAGIPVAVLGVGGYAAILAALLIRGELGRLIAATLALTGFGFSLYLTYLELFVIRAVCQWCVGSALIMTALAPLAVLRVLRATSRAQGGRR